MEINAQLKYAHIAPRKMRLVVDMVKGRDMADAELILNGLVKRSAAPVLKLLKSARASAANNFQLDESFLYVKDIRVNAGPVTKRMMPRAFGRGATIRKRMSHVVLVLEQRQGVRAPIKKRKKEELVVRDAQAEDLKADAAVKDRGEERMRSSGGPKRTTSFTRRIFQRKVI